MATKDTQGKTDDAPEVKAKNVTPEEARFIDDHSDALSDSTQRAKWIHSPDEQPDRLGQTLATQSRQVIQEWAEERGGRPATVPGTEHDDHAGVLRFVFGEIGGKNLVEMSWDEWFKPFDKRQLVFLYQDRKSDGSQSNFFRLDSPEREDA